MRKVILFFAAIAAVSVSCNKENPELNNTAEVGTEVKIYATAPGVELPVAQNQVSPKSVLGADGFSVLWEDGDQIKMCAAPKKSQYSSASEHATSIFTTALSENNEKAMFTGTNVYTTYYQQNTIFIYPASVEYTASRSGSNVSESIKFNLPDAQVAGENGNIRSGYNLSSAYVNALGFNNDGIPNTTFKNSCALIRFVLSSSSATDVKSVTVSSSTPLAGYASLNKSEIMDDRLYVVGWDLSFASSLDKNTSVTLTNGGNAFVQGVEYNIVAWPGTHSDLTFTFENSAGLKCVKKVGKQVVLVKSEVDRFNFTSAFEFKDVATLEVNKENISLTSSASSSSFTVSANNAWTATSNQSWLTVSPTSGSATNSATVNVSASANTTSSSRTATVTIKSSDLTKTITVTQLGAAYKVSGGAVGDAEDLKDGALYVICKKNSSYFMTESNGYLSIDKNHSSSDTFSPKDVFEYKHDPSKQQTFDSQYQSNSGGTLKSLSTGGYLSSSFALNATLSGAQYLSIANRWKNPRYPYTVDPAGDMDVYQADSNYSLWYTGSFTFGAADYNGDVNNRKWVFYEVKAQ